MARTPSFTLPGFFHWLPLLPFGLPIAARLGAAENGWTAWLQPDLWFLIAASLFTGGVLILLCWRWSAGFRIRFLLGVDTLAYAALIAVWVWSARGRSLDSVAWVSFTSPSAGFKIDLPGQPSPEAKLNSQWPGTFSIYRVERKWEEMTWDVGYANLDQVDEVLPLAALYQNFRDGLLADNLGSALMRYRAAEVGDFPGWEVALLRAQGGMLVARMTLVDQRVYVLRVCGPTVGLDHPDVLRFFHSFRLCRREPPSPEQFPGLVAYLPFEEGRGTNTANLSGQPAWLDRAEWTGGVRGKGIRLTGSNRVVLKLPGFRVPAGAPFTLAFWLRTRQPWGSGTVALLADPDTGRLLCVRLENQQLMVFLDGAATRPEKNQRSFLHQKLRVSWIADTAWHHFALCRDRQGGLRTFLDGTSRGQLTEWPALEEIPVQQIVLGAHPEGLAERGLRISHLADLYEHFGYLPGLIGGLDEFCLFRRALRPEEIHSLAGHRSPDHLPLPPPDPEPTPLPTIPLFSGPISQLAFSPDGRTLVTAGPGQPIILWETKTGKEIGRLKDSAFTRPRALAFSADGRLLVCAGNGAIHLWDPATRQKNLQTFRDGPFALSGDGQTLAIAEETPPSVRLLATANGREQSALASPYKRKINGLVFAHDNRRLILATSKSQQYDYGIILGGRGIFMGEGRVVVLDLETQGIRMEVKGLVTETPSVPVLSPDGLLLGGCSKTPRVPFLDLTKDEGHLMATYITPREPIQAITLSPDRQLGATTQADGTVMVWRPMPLELLAVFPGWVGPGPQLDDGALAFVPGGRLLAVIRQGKLEYLSVEHIAALPWPPLDRQRLGLPAENR